LNSQNLILGSILRTTTLDFESGSLDRNKCLFRFSKSQCPPRLKNQDSTRESKSATSGGGGGGTQNFRMCGFPRSLWAASPRGWGSKPACSPFAARSLPRSCFRQKRSSASHCRTARIYFNKTLNSNNVAPVLSAQIVQQEKKHKQKQRRNSTGNAPWPNV
jgi:hypothetical protein